LNWNKWVRQTHRWRSIGLYADRHRHHRRLGTGEACHLGEYVPLLPLTLLLFTGLYLFVLPYGERAAARRKAASPTHEGQGAPR
jgi:hypothetical protein